MNLKFNVLIFLFIATSGISQITFNNPDEGSVVSFQTKNIDLKDVKTEGSPYLDEEFKIGSVIVNGTPKLNGKLRYNAFNSEIELQKSLTEYTAVLKRKYISAKIGDKTYQLLPYKESETGNLRTGYFVALNYGSVKLLFKPEIKLRRGRVPATSYDRLVAPRYIDVSSYYLKQGDEPAQKIYLRSKYIYNALGKKNLKEYVQSNNLKLNNVSDVVQVLNYFNENFSS